MSIIKTLISKLYYRVYPKRIPTYLMWVRKNSVAKGGLGVPIVISSGFDKDIRVEIFICDE